MPETRKICLRCSALVVTHQEGDQMWLMCSNGCFTCLADAPRIDQARLFQEQPLLVDPLDEVRLEQARAKHVEQWTAAAG